MITARQRYHEGRRDAEAEFKTQVPHEKAAAAGAIQTGVS